MPLLLIGGLVGANDGTLTSCYATGHVSGGLITGVGGLVGHNGGTLTFCYATGHVTGTAQYAGGLVGSNAGTIMSCYATGQVTGRWRVGGLVGDNDGTVTACFWDMETTGQDGGSGGKGLTTEQMKTMHIFQNAGWSDYDWEMQD